jgi:sodium-dependent phosphate transporter
VALKSEKFDSKTEEVFKYLQIFTAVCDSFSHGANDVANAIGPFAALYAIYNSEGDLTKKAAMGNDAYWILGMGGIGIATGLFVYGKKITYAIGEKLCKITPSRGVAIELSSALVIIIGSRLKIPLSTTHCQVGATVGVGLLENTKNCSGINCKVFFKTAVGWIITCVIVGLTTVIFIAPGVYSPTVLGWGSCIARNVTN